MATRRTTGADDGGPLSRFVDLACVACVVSVLSAGTAFADKAPKDLKADKSEDGATIVFPLSAALLKEPLTDAADVLTKTLAREMSGTVAASPIEDQVACDLRVDTCLRSTLKSADAGRIVFGTVTGRLRGGVIVKLTTFDRDGEQQRRFVLTSETSEMLSRELSHDLNPDLVPMPTNPGQPGQPSTSKGKTLDMPVDDDKPAGKVTSTTWGLIGGGSAALVIGAGLVISAYGVKSDVEKAPTNTRDDIIHLQELERAGSLRMKIGGVLAVAGGAVATVGIIRLVMQRRAKAPALDVQPEAGGASLVLTLGFP